MSNKEKSIHIIECLGEIKFGKFVQKVCFAWKAERVQISSESIQVLIRFLLGMSARMQWVIWTSIKILILGE